MRDDENQHGDSPTQGGTSPADQSRRAFVRKAALIGIPVVLATIPSRTVWAGPRTYGAAPDASAGGSVNPSGNTAKARVKSLL